MDIQFYSHLKQASFTSSIGTSISCKSCFMKPSPIHLFVCISVNSHFDNNANYYNGF